MPNKKIQKFFLYFLKNSNCSKLQKNFLFSPKKEISKILLHLPKTKIFKKQFYIFILEKSSVTFPVKEHRLCICEPFLFFHILY